MEKKRVFDVGMLPDKWHSCWGICLIMTLLFVNSPLALFADVAAVASTTQATKIIKGTVTGVDKEPLIGVLITVKGTALGVITGADGQYEITNVSNNAILVFSYIGYQKQEIQLKNQSVLNVVMQESNEMLDEVVVVGYGTQKKVTVTGAVSAVSTKELTQSPVANISNSLAGKLTGVTAIQYSGEPGYDGATIWVRGQGTYQTASNPLVIVDGIERAFGDIDPNEIESISILKDASSTAVYGVRGANGVVIVTTKRGSEGKPRINVNVQQAVLNPTRLPEYLESYDALQLYREGLKNDGLNYATYTDEYIEKFRDRSNPTYQYLYPNVNWQEELLRKASFKTQANVNVSGGSGAVRYYISVSYLNQSGMYKHTDLNDYDTQVRSERYNFRSNLDVDFSKRLKMELNLGGIIQDNNFPGQAAGTIFKAIQQTPSWWYPMLNPDGSIGEIAGKNANPYALLTQTGYGAHHTTTLNATVGLSWDMSGLVKGLTAKGRISFDNSNWRNVNRHRSYKSYTFSIDENETDLSKGTYSSVGDGNTTLGYDVIANGWRTAVVEASLNYDRQFGRHQVGLLALYNQQQNTPSVGGGTQNAVAGLPYRRQGLVGRVTYNLDKKYYFEFNAGYNGSENFPKGKRFGFFPAVSGSWLISEENFIKNNVSWLDMLKLRASFGEVGNDQIGGSRFMYMTTWNPNMYGYNFGYVRDGWYLGGAQEATTGNPNVTWERARKIDVGLDIALFNNQLRFTGDIFFEHRTNILTTPLTIPDLSGVESLPLINAGIVDNKGFELELEYRKAFRNASIFAVANFSYARNKIIDMTEPDYVGREWRENEGRRIGEMWGLTAIGLFESEEDIANSPKQMYGDVQPGDIKYKDLNNDNVIDAEDEGFLGRIDKPDKIFGLSLGGSYKGFDLSVLFQGTAGAYIWYSGDLVWPFARFSNVLADVKGNYWSKDNTPAQNAKVDYPRMTSDSNPNNYQASSYWTRSSDYLRLKNLEIGYSLPEAVCKRMGMAGCRFYLTGENLITWDKIKVFDPEMPHNSGNYPQQKIYNIGVNLTF